MTDSTRGTVEKAVKKRKKRKKRKQRKKRVDKAVTYAMSGSYPIVFPKPIFRVIKSSRTKFTCGMRHPQN